MNINFNEIKNILNVDIINPDFSREISGVCIDSRAFLKDNIFVAIKGDRFDSHDFLVDVKNQEASGYIVSSKTKDFYVENNFKNVFVVEDTITAMQCLAKLYLEKIKVKVIAVTGSCGKTTVKDLLSHLLDEKFNVKATKGNLNNHIGVPLTIFSLDGNEDYCILEVGINHFGEMDILANIVNPYVAIITMIGRSHLEGLRDIKGVLDEKWKLIEHVQEDGAIVINGDDKMLLSKILENRNIFRVGVHEDNDFIVETKGDFLEKQKLTIKYKQLDFEFETILHGNSGIYNNVIAFAVGSFLGIKHEYIIERLEKFSPKSTKRFDVKKINDITIIDDTYNANPNSVEDGIKIIRDLSVLGQKIVVLGDMLELGDKSEPEHRNIGKFLNTLHFDYIFCFGDMSRFIVDEIKHLDSSRCMFYDDKNILAKRLKGILKPNDLVYLKASRGMKLEEIIQLILN